MSTGLIEVDEELMWCWQVDTAANIVYVNQRGLYGTTAAAHTTSSFVRNAPRFPRAAIVKALNDTILSAFPDLFAVGSTVITANTAVATYQLPTDVEQVIDVTYEHKDASGYWEPVNRWDVDLNANTTSYANGKTITIYEPILSGRKIQVTYRKKPVVLTLSQDITVSGLQESAKTCLVYGACSRLVGYLESSRLSESSAQAKLIDGVEGGALTNAARYFYQMHLQERGQESRRLQDRYFARPHFTR